MKIPLKRDRKPGAWQVALLVRSEDGDFEFTTNEATDGLRKLLSPLIAFILKVVT